MEHKKTPDILGDLLGGEVIPEKKPAEQASTTPEYHNTGMPVSQSAIKPARKKKEPAAAEAPAPAKEQEEAPGEKAKATFYISSEVIEALEDGWIRLRKLTPKERRGQVSKSLIVELAIQMALEDLESKGVKSLLAKKASKE